VLFVNGRNDLRVPVIAGNPLTFSLQGPPAGGNGKFIVHLNSGGPTGGDLTLLPAELGTACFPMLVPPNGTADPDAIWNNLGKVALVGASEYFGEPGEDPERAPTSFLQRVPGHPDNMPIGTTWTIQGVVVNPTGSSPKAVSLTNAVVFEVIQ